MKAIFFLLAFVSTSAYADLKGSSTSWEFESSIDEFTDEKKASAVILAEEGLNKGFIMISCYPSGFEGKVSAGEYIGDKEISGNVKYRVDKNEAVETTMNPTSKIFVYFNDLNSPFIKALMEGKEKVIVQLTSYDYDTSKASFTLNGAATAISKVIQACHGK